MFPVYRVSEGVENLEHNYKTFEHCLEIFKQDGIVLIFSEGRCINEWHLRPLKKGTARLALSAWAKGIPLQVLPTGINYSSFDTFGKNVFLNFGAPISAKDIDTENSFGKSVLDFNEQLNSQLQQLVFEMDKKDEKTIKQKFFVEQPLVKKIILVIPAAAGWLVHFPLYYPIKKIIWAKVKDNDHYDSVMTGLLFILYPFYLLLVGLLLHFFTGGWWWVLTFIVTPFCAWSYVQLKKQF